MTDEEAIEMVKAGLEEIRESPTKYGQVHLIVAGGEVKFVNVEKPPRVKFNEHSSANENRSCK